MTESECKQKPEEWEVELGVARKPSERHKGFIGDSEFREFFLELKAWALGKGYVVESINQPKGKRRNCPHCGRLIRVHPGRPLDRCPVCQEPLAARLTR